MSSVAGSSDAGSSVECRWIKCRDSSPMRQYTFYFAPFTDDPDTLTMHMRERSQHDQKIWKTSLSKYMIRMNDGPNPTINWYAELIQNAKDTIPGVITTGFFGDGSKVAINGLLQSNQRVEIVVQKATRTTTPVSLYDQNDVFCISNISDSCFEGKHILQGVSTKRGHQKQPSGAESMQTLNDSLSFVAPTFEEGEAFCTTVKIHFADKQSL